MIRPPPRSTLFPTRRSSDLSLAISSSAPWWTIVLGIRVPRLLLVQTDRKSTRLNSSHLGISYAVFCLKKKKKNKYIKRQILRTHILRYHYCCITNSHSHINV